MTTSPLSVVLRHLRANLRPDGDDITDGELLARFLRCRDGDALAALVRRHASMVWGVCRRLLHHHDAEDAFQATFLVLARKAAAVPRQAVANWLYGVARQTAVRLRAAAAKRRRRETQVVNMPEPTVPEAWDADLHRVVDEELSRLPDHYRGVAILCDLEGLTRKEAARQLGIPEGSVASRLARARALLARRLARRGVVVSGGSAAAVLAAGPASASAPPALVASTIRAASLLAAGPASGVVSARVAALTEGTVKAMLMTRIKGVLAVLLAVAALAGASGLIYRTQASEPPQAKEGPHEAATPGGRVSLNEAVHRKGQTRIMPLGDSITNAAGWRVYLQDLLKKNGYTFRMVGGRNDPLLPEGYWSDHGGCGGWTIGSFPASQEFGGADVDWAGSRPDVVLLMIGTNDMQWGHRKGAVGQLGRLLDKIWADVPDAVILVAQITPFAPGSRVNDRKDGSPLDKEVQAYNQGIAKLVAERVKAGKRVVLVDQHTGFDPAKDLADKCHPNKAGHRKMARKWFKAIQAITAKGSDYPNRALPPVVRVTTDGDKGKVGAPGDKIRLTGTLVDAGGKGLKVTYAWRKLCGPGDVAFDAGNQLTTTAKFTKAGGYCLAFTASNGKATSRSDVQVVVTKASSGGDQATPGKPGRVIGIALGTALRPTDAAGVVPRPRWNTVKLRESTVAKASDLLDDGGKKTSASYRLWSNNAVPAENADRPDTPNGRLLRWTYRGNNFVSHRIRGIPFARYDLYLYFHHAAGKRPEKANHVHGFRVRDLETDQTILGPLYVKNVGGPFTTWVRAATNQVEDRKEATPAANYVLVPDLAAKDVEVLTSAGSSLCGIQVVERRLTDK